MTDALQTRRSYAAMGLTPPKDVLNVRDTPRTVRARFTKSTSSMASEIISGRDGRLAVEAGQL